MDDWVSWPLWILLMCIFLSRTCFQEAFCWDLLELSREQWLLQPSRVEWASWARNAKIVAWNVRLPACKICPSNLLFMKIYERKRSNFWEAFFRNSVWESLIVETFSESFCFLEPFWGSRNWTDSTCRTRHIWRTPRVVFTLIFNTMFFELLIINFL